MKQVEQPTRAGQDAERMDMADNIMRRVLNAAARSEPSARNDLIEHIRFQESSIYNARAAIIAQYARPGSFTLGKCRDHLHFLYLTHPLRQCDTELHDMAIVDSEMRLAKPHLRDIYLPGLADYSPQALLASRAGEGLDASFVHPAFLEDPPAALEASYPVWKKWLCDSLGVRDQVRLVSRDGRSLADAFVFVAKTQRHKVLGLLAQIWEHQGHNVLRNPSLKETLRNLPVHCTSAALHPLWETYLPVPDLEAYAELFLAEGTFPFLDLEEEDTLEEMAAQWSFLHTDLGVSAKHDTAFLLDVLSAVKEANPQGLSEERCRKLARLYHDIESKCAESHEPVSMRQITW